MMKRYIFTITASLLLTSVIFAQQQPADTLLRRQMELERDFNPTSRAANKINSVPALPQPVIQRANTNFSTWAGRTTPPLEIALPRPATTMTEIPFDRSRGYISLNAGNYANVDGAAGYRFIDNGRSMLGLNLLHNSTNGNVNYVQEDSDPKSNKLFLMDNFGQLRFNQIFDALHLNMHVSYLHSMFNYYGNTFSENRWFENENQQLGIFNANIGFESQNTSRFGYRGSVDLKNFHTKFGDSLSQNGIRGNEIDAMLGFSQPFSAGAGNSRIGIDGRFFTTIYGDTIQNYSQMTAAPYIAFEGDRFMARLGADVQFQFIDGNKVRVVPNVDVNLLLSNHSSLYAKVHGGFNPNTFVSMMNESRYITPIAAATTKPSFTVVDLEAGIRIGELSGFRFDIFGGFRQTDDEHFLVMNQIFDPRHWLSSMYPNPYPLVVRNIETLAPLYGNLSHSHVGGMIQSNIWAPLNLSARIKKNFYTIKEMGDDAKAYNKPGIETDIYATFEATSALRFTLNYYFAGDRWANFSGTDIKMNNINDLNFGATYRITDFLSVNLKANNLLFQKYDIWYGFPAQGFNAMGGFTFKF
jgi:hypothetical protein